MSSNYYLVCQTLKVDPRSTARESQLSEHGDSQFLQTKTIVVVLQTEVFGVSPALLMVMFEQVWTWVKLKEDEGERRATLVTRTLSERPVGERS
ncbi:hypothetical protein CVT26_004957 [Gymnopilus dilepis]|uniref:Uncharacterized protein n=1 Tax=Gymnopilus dilepis TaxID=231916 RepID=A0A409Y038_9AGAR|nr:hypothetical protein CVT26_004957 [Gymnopilus dilepis]